MDRKWIGLIALALLLPLAGCGSSEPTSATKQAVSAEQSSSPDKAVAQFLEAVRTGNDQVAGGMLTAVARQKTTEMQLVVAPPGSETAKFQVGEVEFIGNEGAHVASTWVDIADDGQPHSDEIVWILRKEAEGWRISGMGTRIFEDQPPLLLNFEDPEDMINKQRLAEEEIQRRMQAAASQAQKPAAPAAPQRQ